MKVNEAFEIRRRVVQALGLAFLLAIPSGSFGRPPEPRNEQECRAAGGKWQVMSHITGEYGCYFAGRPAEDPGRPGGPVPAPPNFPDLPDLAVGLVVRSGSIFPGSDIGPALQLKVTNVGDRVAPRSFIVDLTLAGIPDVPRSSVFLKEIVSPYGLAPGETRVYPVFGAVIPFNERPGVASVCATVDPRNTIREYNKNNNTVCTGITLSPNTVIFRPAVR